MDHRVLLGLLVPLVLLDTLDLKGWEENLDRLVLREIRVHKAHEEMTAPLERMATLDLLDNLDQMETMAQTVVSEHLDLLDLLDLREIG